MPERAMSSHEERSWLGGEPGGPWWPEPSPAEQPFGGGLPFGYPPKVSGPFASASASPYQAATQAPGHWWYPAQDDPRPPTQVGSNNRNDDPPVGVRRFNSSQYFAPLLQTKATMSKTKSETKPRGRMTAYAYFVQICREEHKKNHPEEHVAFADFSKKCAERWKTMSDKEKKRFHELEKKKKKRYETEMKDYIPSENEKGRRTKKRKQIKDPNAPKRPLSAFFCFCNDERQKVKEANPEFGVGDIAKELGRRWSEASPSTKSKYEEVADKDKARYEREMIEYKKKGKFVGSVNLETKEEAIGDDDDEDDEDE